jgi:hypothetical protein
MFGLTAIGAGREAHGGVPFRLAQRVPPLGEDVELSTAVAGFAARTSWKPPCRG